MLPLLSVNQRFPSGPGVMPEGELKGVGIGNSVKAPEGDTRPMLLALYSVNHRFPSGPAVISCGQAAPGR